uniref:Acyltransferase n=1 Tax=Pinguiococcus pyrenoidosus TaxID=172671 RepID=A0A7R9YEL6_9STRA
MAKGKGAISPPLPPDGGLFLATLFTVIFVFSPLYMLLSLILLCYAPCRLTSYLFAAPWIVSALLPPVKLYDTLRTPFMAGLCNYFRYREIQETSDEEILQMADKRPVIIVQMPHGVIAFGGICGAVYPGRHKGIMPRFPTAVASILTKLPLLKHTMGIFGLIEASKPSLERRLKKGGSFVLYTGGIAELFLCTPEEEKLFLMQRKGFIKLALRSNAEVVPVFLFGNTEVLHAFKHPVLEQLSRSLQMSMTWIWGRWGLPVPLQKQIVYCRGSPIGLPHIPKPTEEDVNKWHAVFCDEVRRLFEEYKGKTDYGHKSLVFV